MAYTPAQLCSSSCLDSELNCTYKKTFWPNRWPRAFLSFRFVSASSLTISAIINKLAEPAGLEL